ncbi:ABC transporter permease [Sphingobium sp. AN641]|uniref:ABC transporter permease n=1 Tax=Sphingobium sp. AN641 TaxID=3133443 RepID=UPI0030BF2511
MSEIMRAAYVIARRDFSAVVFSKTFFFFLLGPLFPILIGMAFGGLGEKISTTDLRPIVGIALPAADAARIERTHAILTERMGPQALPRLRRVATDETPAALLARTDSGVAAILSGSIDRPRLTGKAADIDRLEGDVSLLVSATNATESLRMIPVERHEVATSRGAQAQAQMLLGRVAQVVIFFLTLILAGMVLSNLVEEKTNKIIEILAAAVPIDAIFLGKLLAMLAMSFVGILFWGGSALAIFLATRDPATIIATPAVGWTAFIALGVAYFTMAYTLLGSLFLGIGAQAATVREVQTLNMPVTMAQMLIFFFASYAVDHQGSAADVAAMIFPWSSPFAMIAHAAYDDAIWPHLLALLWQAIFVAVIIRVGVLLFRRHVLKSGGAGWRGLFRRRSAWGA